MDSVEEPQDSVLRQGIIACRCTELEPSSGVNTACSAFVYVVS